MRILYVTPFAQKVSGPDESLIGLLQCLRGLINPLVVLPPGSPQVERYEKAGAIVIEQPMQRIHRTLSPFSLAAYGGLFAPETYRFLRLIRDYKIDLVHTNMEVVLQSGLAARMAHIPTVYHVRGTSFARPRRVCDAVVGAINRLSDEIIVISRAVGDIFYERNIREKVSVIHNSLNPSYFDSIDENAMASIRFELSGGTNAPLVATVGRINPRKGLECFIKAAALVAQKNSTIRFAIVGDAADDFERAYMAKIRELAGQLGIRDRLVIAPARRNIAELMSAIDIFVMTTLNEGFGRVAIEAMAARRAVIASDVGGLPEIIQDNITGRLIQPDQPAAFAAAILELLAYPDMALEMGKRGRQHVEECFNDDTQASKVMRVYQRALNSGKKIPATIQAL